MCNDLVPLVFLIFAPLAYFAPRLGLASTRTLRLALALLALGLVWLRLPPSGLDAASLDRVKLLLAAWTAGALILRHTGAVVLRDRRRWRIFLAATAAAALLTHTNFLSFHNGAFVQYHDAAHYYLGAKYFPELGYGRLYTAMLRAEAESTGDALPVERARDLATNALVPATTLVAQSNPVKAAFSPERWTDFRADVAGIHGAMGGAFAKIFADHGFNPTPVWPLVGGALARLVPAGSQTGLTLLALLDPALELAAFAAITWGFGLETALVATIHLAIVYGASFDWLGGAFLRQLWLASVVVSAACLARGRPGLAGASLAVAATLRIFPGFFALGFFLRAAIEMVTGAGIRVEDRRFLIGFATAAALLIALTLPGGADAWGEFVANTRTHVQSLSANTIGLTNVLAYSRDLGVGSSEGGLEALVAWRSTVYRLQLAIVFPAALAALAALAWRAPRLAAPALLAAGVLPLFAALTLSAYYYVLLVVLILGHAERPDRVAMVLLVELVTYVLALFEVHEPVVYLYRGLLVLYLVGAIHWDEIARAPSPLRRAPSGAGALG